MKIGLLLSFYCWLALSLSAQTNLSAVRLAILPETSDVQQPADLLTAEFSQHPGVQLIERAEMDKILREQQLSLQNIDSLKLGRLLGADGLLILDTAKDGTNEVLNCRLVAVKPGVVLAGERFNWPLNRLTEWSSWLVKHYDSQLPKLGVLAKDAIPVSVVNFRSALASVDVAETERQLQVLTVQRLSREPRLFVLERQKLQSLDQEKTLSADESAFWNGAYVLDGVMDQNGFSKDTITINARLIPAKGGAPVLLEASGNRTNLAEVINALSAKIVAALRINPAAKEWSATDEAEQFFLEAKWALSWGEFKEAQTAADSAWALGKHDQNCAVIRIKSYITPLHFKYQRETYTNPTDLDDVVQTAKRHATPNPAWGLTIRDQSCRGIRFVQYVYTVKYPDLANVELALKALEFYYDFSRHMPEDSLRTTAARSSEWDDLGIEDLTAASQVLQNFNLVTAAREESTDKLMELRKQARLVAEMIFQSPEVQASYFVGDRIATRDQLNDPLRERANIFMCMVNWGCYWQEHPEDGIALYYRLLESPAFCYLHEKLWSRDIAQPRLVAWNEKDELRIPQVWENFIGSLARSTNLLWQLEAKALSLTGICDEEKFCIQFTNLFETIFTNGDALVANQVELLSQWDAYELIAEWNHRCGLHSDKIEALERNYFSSYRPKLWALNSQYSEKTVPAARTTRMFSKQKEFLLENRPYNFTEFIELFRDTAYSQEQARELLPLIIAYKSNLLAQVESADKRQKFKLQSDAQGVSVFLELKVEGIVHPAPPKTPVVRIPPVKTSVRTVEPIAIMEPETITNIIEVKKYLEVPLPSFEGELTSAFISAHHWQENKLVLDMACGVRMYTYDSQGNWKGTQNAMYPVIAILDPVSERWTVLCCPEADLTIQNLYYHRTTLWRGQVFTSEGEQIKKYDAENKKWQALGIPDIGNCELFTVNDRLFAATPNLILEILEGGRQTHILASNRRQPPGSALDTENLGTPVLYAGLENDLRVATANKIFSWNGSNWIQICSAPYVSVVPKFFDGGLLFCADGWNAPAGIWRLGADSGQVEFCFGQSQSAGFRTASMSPEKPVFSRWKSPAGHKLDPAAVTARSTDLLLLYDHTKTQDIVDEQQHLIIGKKFLSQNGYHAELFNFSTNLPAPLGMGLKFEDYPGVGLPFAIEKHSVEFAFPGDLTSWMCFCGDRLLLGCEYAKITSTSQAPYFLKPGVWVLSSQLIDSEIFRFKKAQAERQAQVAAAARQTASDLFEKYDRNHDGMIDGDEKEAALADEKFVALELDKIDVNHNGLLDAEELKYFDANHDNILEPNEQIAIETAQRLLTVGLIQKYDIDGDGLLNRAEYNSLTQAFNGQPLNLGLGVHFPDDNHDGKVDWREMLPLCKSYTNRALHARSRAAAVLPMTSEAAINRPFSQSEALKLSVEFYWQCGGTNASELPASVVPLQPPNVYNHN